MLLWLYQDRSHEDHLLQAFYGYKRAIYSGGDRCSTIWMSVALLYFYINEYYNCLNAMGQSIRLDPCEPLVWRNLGILVSSNFSHGQRCLSLITASSTTIVSIKTKM